MKQYEAKRMIIGITYKRNKCFVYSIVKRPGTQRGVLEVLVIPVESGITSK